MKYGMNDSMLYFVVDTRLLQKRWPIPWTWMARNLAASDFRAMLAAFKNKGTSLVKLDIHMKPKNRVSLPLIRLMKPPISSSPMAQKLGSVNSNATLGVVKF
jgi:hypothetical protein